MESPDISFIVTLITGVASVVLAIFAIWFSKTAERESRANFEKTRDLLAEIDKRATVTEKTVAESHQQLLNTVTNLLNRTAVPTKPDIGEELGMKFMEALMQNPSQAEEMVKGLQPLIEMSEKSQNQSGKNPQSQKPPRDQRVRRR